MASTGAVRRAIVLLAEDDAATGLLETECLEPLGLELLRAATAAQVEAALRTATPDLLVLDYLLPGCTAPELLARLRGAGVTVPPFLLVSGCPDEDLSLEAGRCGAAGFVVKDKNFLDSLPAAVKKALAAGAPR